MSDCGLFIPPQNQNIIIEYLIEEIHRNNDNTFSIILTFLLRNLDKYPLSMFLMLFRGTILDKRDNSIDFFTNMDFEEFYKGDTRHIVIAMDDETYEGTTGSCEIQYHHQAMCSILQEDPTIKLPGTLLEIIPDRPIRRGEGRHISLEIKLICSSYSEHRGYINERKYVDIYNPKQIPNKIFNDLKLFVPYIQRENNERLAYYLRCWYSEITTWAGLASYIGKEPNLTYFMMFNSILTKGRMKKKMGSSIQYFKVGKRDIGSILKSKYFLYKMPRLYSNIYEYRQITKFKIFLSFLILLFSGGGAGLLFWLLS